MVFALGNDCFLPVSDNLADLGGKRGKNLTFATLAQAAPNSLPLLP